MATERLKPGQRITVTVEANDPNGRDSAIRELSRWARENELVPDLTHIWPKTVHDDGVDYHEYSTQVWTDVCAICDKPLGPRNYPVGDGDQRAHGPCKGFDERRIADGFPQAKDYADLRRLVRHAMDRGE